MAASFIISFGFYGLEYVAIELDDPFGDDENDLDVFGMSESVVSDIRLFLIDCDGIGADRILGEKVFSDQPRSWTGERVHEQRSVIDVMKRKEKKKNYNNSPGFIGELNSFNRQGSSYRSSVERNASTIGVSESNIMNRGSVV